jgi:hypothetical protein
MLRFVYLLCLITLVLPAAETVRHVEFEKWPGCFELNAPAKNIRAVVVPQIGARLLHYSINGENVLYHNSDTAGKTLATHPKGFWAGGYQLDVGPEMRGIPPHQSMWMGPWACKFELNGVLAISENDTATGLCLQKRISIDADTGALRVRQSMKNHTDKELSYCLWDRTLVEGGGYAIIKLNPKSRFKAGWCEGTRNEQSKGGWDYDGDTPSAPEVKVIDGVLVSHNKAQKNPGNKIGADTDSGWIAYALNKTLFIKQYPVDAKGNYTDGGMNVANYWSNRVGELEPISPEVTLKSGESYSFDETWHLLALDEPVDSHEKARALLPKIEALLKP